MLRKIKLKGHSFYNNNFLVEISENTFKLETDLGYRVGLTEDNKRFIDPSGRPMLVEGEPIEDTGIIIKTIKNPNLITV